MILGRLICILHAEQLSLIPVKWVTRVFVTGDVIAFSLQAGGGGIQSSGTLRLRIRPTRAPAKSAIPWMRHLWVLYVTSDIILVRSVFRVIKYLQGNDGYIISHKIFLYVFDTILIAAVAVIFLIWHVGERCPKRKAYRDVSAYCSGA
ncbi:hypothetical protein BGZ61DRAFT_490245 [Ilyonectria robusta]|uniref:uncharacterized protein n=1 Tax=Ilyonectria robusta TaxID=1079257 RepID=UPI001E8CA1A3|nr:uncharacterized protein BGZ61DRAFT_490245 [Ilyonectria robusta]KAH8736642.1 hypothetical protein BGZ61DRAFT_490245 [Ilyonectria robusta]